MMEKITIVKVSEIAKPGKTTFWSCECANGSKYTVWDENLINVIKQNLNIECEADVKQSGNFWNIRAFTPSNITPPAQRIEVNPSQNCETCTKPLASIRDTSIVAQCMVKAVFSQPCNFATEVKTIQEAVEMYKSAVKLLNG